MIILERITDQILPDLELEDILEAIHSMKYLMHRSQRDYRNVIQILE